jgi:hypothetical protein
VLALYALVGALLFVTLRPRSRQQASHRVHP